MKTPLSRLVSRATSFLLRGRRPRFDHAESHRPARPDQHAGLINHYRPSPPATGGGLHGPM
ncbi:hypothetical protein [Streptomyces sp. NPDC048650]|uniref:hypothetical protein n=1 Tax=unclassified Streptomyces TaxID=2593676 RepID=UPI003711BC02